MQKTAFSMILAAGVLASALPAAADSGKEDGSHRTLTLAIYGDSPYGQSNADTAQFNATPAFIATINADRDVSLVVHVGDIHSGKQKCTQVYDQAIYAMWLAFQSPLVYAPGDNEWTDCQKSGEAGGVTDPMGLPPKNWSEDNFRARRSGGSMKENRDEQVPLLGRAN